MKNLYLAFLIVLVVTTSAVTAQAITIGDGFDDWNDIPAIFDTVGDTSVNDWVELKLDNDATNLYLYYKTIGGDVFSLNYTYLDTDQNADTGCDLGYIQGRLGAEYLLSKANLCEYYEISNGWGYSQILTCESFSSTDYSDIEIAVPLNLIGNPEGIDILLYSRYPFVTDAEDYLPDSGVVSYSIEGETGPVPEPSTLLLLGSGILGFVPFLKKKS